MAKNEQMLRLVLIEQLLRRRKDRGEGIFRAEIGCDGSAHVALF